MAYLQLLYPQLKHFRVHLIITHYLCFNGGETSLTPPPSVISRVPIDAVNVLFVL
jgi:hypothetical protein